jgi:hypothetical protein
VFYADDVGRVRRSGKAMAFIAVVACTVGLVVALASRDTPQRALVTTLIYGVAAALLFSLVSLRPDKPRTGRQSVSALEYDSWPRERS